NTRHARRLRRRPRCQTSHRVNPTAALAKSTLQRKHHWANCADRLWRPGANPAQYLDERGQNSRTRETTKTVAPLSLSRRGSWGGLHLTFALTCDGAFLLQARRRQVQRVVRQRALSLGGPPWPCETRAIPPMLHRQV